jgi:DNA-directed RNA polymerase specialized sigma24 family protein
MSSRTVSSRTVSSRTVSSGRSTVARTLDHEWAVLRFHRAALERGAAWDVVPSRIDDLDTVVGATQAHVIGGERALRRLVERAATDQLAARVVLQRLLPGIGALARRRGRADAAAFDELVGAAWIAIVTFDPARRPASIAAALLTDADHRAYRSRWRRRSSAEVPVADALEHTPADVDPVDAATEVADLLALATPVVDDDELALVRRLLDGETTEQIAAASGVTARMIRYRRARVTSRLRDLALAA